MVCSWILNCLTCLDGPICTSCKPDSCFNTTARKFCQYLATPTCILCNSTDVGCITCGPDLVCTACKAGYLLEFPPGLYSYTQDLILLVLDAVYLLDVGIALLGAFVSDAKLERTLTLRQVRFILKKATLHVLNAQLSPTAVHALTVRFVWHASPDLPSILPPVPHLIIV